MSLAPRVRAQIAQIEKFNIAVNTFQVKFNALPGDMNSVTANAFGFAPRGTLGGQGDGNGIIEGYGTNCAANQGTSTYSCGWGQGTGETAMFWSDLSYANGMNVNMIEGTFSSASPTTSSGNVSANNVGLYLPQAKIGGGNFIYVWSGGVSTSSGNTMLQNGINYFGIMAVTSIGSDMGLRAVSNIVVNQAYNIDN